MGQGLELAGEPSLIPIDSLPPHMSRTSSVCKHHPQRAAESLKKSGLEVFVFDEVEENPSNRHVENGVRFARPLDIALIVSDVVMPEMGGISLLKTLREGGWKTAVLLLTGHPLNKELDEALTYPDVEWLSKPVGLEQLADAVSRCLEKKVHLK